MQMWITAASLLAFTPASLLLLLLLLLLLMRLRPPGGGTKAGLAMAAGQPAKANTRPPGSLQPMTLPCVSDGSWPGLAGSLLLLLLALLLFSAAAGIASVSTMAAARLAPTSVLL
jgi:hypothetical protein